MMPVYKYRDSSNPHQRHQIGYQKPFPAYIPINPSKPPMVYEPWPCSGNYGFPSPMPNSSCCNNHGNLPDFHGFRASCPHQMASPVSYCGDCPVPYFAEPNPVYYAPHSHPHYTAEMPRYEYDKSMPWNRNYHCCECPNHHHRGDGGVKIQEQELDGVEGNGNGSLVPVRVKGFPHLVWIPKEGAKDLRRPFEAEESNESLPWRIGGAESLNSRELERNNWNGFPDDGDKIKCLTIGGDEKRDWERKSEEKKKEYPFPLIWMPSYDGRQEGEKKENKNVDGDRIRKGEDQIEQFPFPIFWMHPQDKKQAEVGDKDNKDASASPKLAESLPYVFNFVPMKHIGENNSTEDSKVSEENTPEKDCSKAKEKGVAQKNIAVKQIDPPKEEEKELEEDNKRNKTSKSSGNDGKRQSSLLTKSSNKLPPVCLRVDPLPKKKNGNRTSRSPSPPRSIEHSQQSSDGTTGASSVLEESILSNKKEVDPKNPLAKEILVRERTSDASLVPVMVPENPATKEMAEKINVEKKKSSDVDTEPKHTSDDPNVSVEVLEKPCIDKDGNDGDGDGNDCQTSVEMAEKAIDSAKSENEKRPEKKILSEVEAALKIQSSYRGFDIRRSEPLKKLKQMAEVREQMVKVQNCIQALESSSDLQKDDKQKLVLGETIMRLLLKLDTIQGLHPSLKDIRKSLAKELVTLQEKLDSLVFKPEKVKLEKYHVRPVEEVSVEADGFECKRGKSEETEDHQNSDVVESGQNQLLPVMDSEPSSEGDEKSLTLSESTAPGLVSDGDNLEDKVGSDLKLEECNSEAEIEHKDEVREVDKAPMGDEVAREVPLNGDVNSSDIPSDSLEATDATLTSTRDIDLSKEVADDKHSKTTEDAKEVELVKASELTLPSEIEEVKATELKAELHELAELPIEAIDEDCLRDKESKFLGTTGTALSKETTLDEIGKPKEALEETALTEELNAGYEKHDECSFPSEAEELQALIAPEEKGSQIALQDGEIVEENKEDELVQEQTSGEMSDGESETRNERDKRLVEENKKLRETMSKLIEAAQQQLSVISTLDGRVKELEKKLSKKKKKLRTKCGASRAKRSNVNVGLAM